MLIYRQKQINWEGGNLELPWHFIEFNTTDIKGGEKTEAANSPIKKKWYVSPRPYVSSLYSDNLQRSILSYFGNDNLIIYGVTF